MWRFRQAVPCWPCRDFTPLARCLAQLPWPRVAIDQGVKLFARSAAIVPVDDVFFAAEPGQVENANSRPCFREIRRNRVGVISALLIMVWQDHNMG